MRSNGLCSDGCTGSGCVLCSNRANAFRQAYIPGNTASLRPPAAVEHNNRSRHHMPELLRHRATFIEYLRHRIEDEDWHGASEAANDLRELDCEIRMTEAAR